MLLYILNVYVIVISFKMVSDPQAPMIMKILMGGMLFCNTFFAITNVLTTYRALFHKQQTNA
jgi:hypothetical protein